MITEFKIYEKLLNFKENDVLFVNKLEQFFNEIKMKEHGVRRFPETDPPQAVQIYHNQYSKFMIMVEIKNTLRYLNI